MNYNKSCMCLGLAHNFTKEELRQRYLKLSLRFHPDKNPCVDAKDKFQEINEAYLFLNNEIKADLIKETSYEDLLYCFLKSFSKQQWILPIIHKLIKDYENYSHDLLDKMEDSLVVDLYETVIMFKNIIKLPESFLIKLKEKAETQMSKKKNIVLHPSLDDLLDGLVYKGHINNMNFYVPLWHVELIYEIKDEEYLVQCNPILEDYVNIDNENDVHIFCNMYIQELLKKEKVEIPLTKNKNITVEVNKIKIQPKQVLSLFGEGIPKIDAENIYDISYSNLYIHLSLF